MCRIKCVDHVWRVNHDLRYVKAPSGGEEFRTKTSFNEVVVSMDIMATCKLIEVPIMSCKSAHGTLTFAE